MDWKENKWIGIAAGALVLICLVLALIPFIRSRIELRKVKKEGIEWLEREKEKLVLSPEGWSIGMKRKYRRK